MAEEPGLELGVDPELAALEGDGGRARLYREVLSNFASGVTVVTAFDADGSPRGLTLVAFCGVSLDPPLVLVCVDRSSNTLPAIRHSGGFTVNLVHRGSDEVAKLMATKAVDKLTRIAWRRPRLAEGGPVLTADASAHIVCRTWSEAEAGDHLIVVGEVMEGGVSEGPPPLVFHRRTFRDLGDPRR